MRFEAVWENPEDHKCRRGILRDNVKAREIARGEARDMVTLSGILNTLDREGDDIIELFDRKDSVK